MSKTHDHILLVEDNLDDAHLVQRMIRATGHRARFEHVTRLSAAEERIRTGDVDAVLLDLGLRDSAGIDMISRLKAAGDVPVVIFSRDGNGHSREAILSSGAAEVLERDRLNSDELAVVLDRLLTRARSRAAAGVDAGWIEFVAESTARLNARLYHATAWLDHALTQIQHLRGVTRPAASISDAPMRVSTCPPKGSFTAELDPLALELLDDVQRAVSASKDELRDILALGTRVQRTMPSGRDLSATGTLGPALEVATEIIAAELAPRFEVRARDGVAPDLPVESRTLIGLLRRIAHAVARVSSCTEGSAHLSLSSHRDGSRVVVTIDAEVPALDQRALAERLDTITAGPLCPGETQSTTVRLRSMRGSLDRTIACLEVLLTEMQDEGEALPPPSIVGEEWSRRLDEIGRILATRGPSRSHRIGALEGALARTVHTWPRHAMDRAELLDEVEQSVPGLCKATACAAARGLELGERLHALRGAVEAIPRTSDRARVLDGSALRRVERDLRDWLEAARADDRALGTLLVDSMWSDLGTPD